MLIEQKLIKRIKKKQNKEAANALISYYYKEVYAYVYRQTGNEELAKDLTQDIFIQILQKITIFDHKKASFRTWMYRILLSNHSPYGSFSAYFSFTTSSAITFPLIVSTNNIFPG